MPAAQHTGRYDLDYHSGRQTRRALAYRLALNRVINDIITDIKTRNLLILDEPTDGFSTEQLDKLRTVLEELNISYPSGTIDDANVLRDYRVIGMPSTYFIKPDGEVHSTWTGLLTHDQLSSMVQELLAASGR